MTGTSPRKPRVAVPLSWVWIVAVAWVVADVLFLAAGWDDVRQVGQGVLRTLAFAACLHWIARVVGPSPDGRGKDEP
jgi:hypothetical protein